jgi:hypothetical protein
MKNKNRYAECAREFITADASGKNVFKAEIDPYSGIIKKYEIWEGTVEKIQKRRIIARMFEQLNCRLRQRSPAVDASIHMKPLTIKELEELVRNAISRGNKLLG